MTADQAGDASGYPEETLDPIDWPALRTLGHRMLDDMFAYLETIRQRPVWQPMPETTRQLFSSPLPETGQPADEVYQEFCQHILPYNMGNTHPRFWSWVMGGGTPLGMLAEMLAAGMNPNVGGGDHAGTIVETQLLDWCKELMGFPADGSGLLVSGGSMANLLGLAVARSAMIGDVRRDGLVGLQTRPTLYGSAEMHSSVQRAVELLGFGDRCLRRIPVDNAFRISLPALQAAIAEDRAHGLQPICLIGNAGTTNTGAIDPLTELAEIAAEQHLWFHVDGAFGALAALAPTLRHLVQGMERADSLAFDLHKWGYLPFEIGCLLVRDAAVHRRTFALQPDYLKHAERGLAAGTWYGDYGVELTRGFRALKAWMSLKNEGVAKLGRLIAQNVDQARYLGELVVSASPNMTLLAPVTLNVVCFRFEAPSLDDAALDTLNEELLLRVQESGVAMLSGTRVHERYALRCAITNHRSRREDFEILIDSVLRLGREVAS